MIPSNNSNIAIRERNVESSCSVYLLKSLKLSTQAFSFCKKICKINIFLENKQRKFEKKEKKMIKKKLNILNKIYLIHPFS